MTPPRTDRQPAAPASGGSTVTAVVRTADVLTFLAQAPPRPVGVTEIATGLGLSKAVVFRILVSLQDRGYVEFDARSRRYLLGPKSLALGMAYLERTETRRSVHDALVTLSARTEETATLSLRTGWQRMYVDQVLPPDDIKMVVPIGRLFPLHAGASSKAFLAFLPQDERERFFAEHRHLPALTERTVIDERALRAELDEIRAAGFASSRGERQPGAASVAAPVFDAGGAPAAVISVCGPIDRFEARRENAVRLLLEETRLLSRQVHRGSPLAF
ncbi:MAG TPA: IclR family transcriptional regulator [Solirubrobacteraceae bacterium]|nr:IclR family transcriptional regulator [Solirubrobacteraceae bacterium]